VSQEKQYHFADLARLYGAIGLICMQDRVYGMQFINEVQRRLAPSVRRGHYRLYSNTQGFPLGFAHWAWADDMTLRRLSEGDDHPADEWIPGPHLVCIDLIIAPGLRERILKDLFAIACPQRDVAFYICRKDGNCLKELKVNG
jgi:hemolysin-activating ACP:hemolysin acyltransferase